MKCCICDCGVLGYQGLAIHLLTCHRYRPLGGFAVDFLANTCRCPCGKCFYVREELVSDRGLGLGNCSLADHLRDVGGLATHLVEIALGLGGTDR